MRVRIAAHSDLPFLWEMLYQAIYVPAGADPLPRGILDHPKVSHYLEDFPARTGDVGWIAEVDGQAIGAVWCRRMPASDPGYGFVGPDIPELTIAVGPMHRGHGVGSALLRTMLAYGRTHDWPAVSLSVDHRNPARHLYGRFGFQRVASNRPEEYGWTMVKQLSTAPDAGDLGRPDCGEEA